MITVTKRLCAEKNLAGLVAGTWGFLFGSAVTLTLTGALVVWLHGTDVALWVACGVNGLLTTIGCLFLLGLEWVNPSVKDTRSFAGVVGSGFLAALFMPIIVAMVLFVMATWKMLLTVFVRLWILFRMTGREKELEDAYHKVPQL